MDFKFTDPNASPEQPIKVVFSGSYEDTPDIKELFIEEGIEEIAENAFRDFENLEIIHFPKSLRQISACAFAGCKNPRSIFPSTRTKSG